MVLAPKKAVKSVLRGDGCLERADVAGLVTDDQPATVVLYSIIPEEEGRGAW
jgi:hypothetical protein